MNYDYYKKKYKKLTLQFDRERDADIILFLEQFPGKSKQVISECLRFLMAQMVKGSDRHVN